MTFNEALAYPTDLEVGYVSNGSSDYTNATLSAPSGEFVPAVVDAVINLGASDGKFNDVAYTTATEAAVGTLTPLGSQLSVEVRPYSELGVEGEDVVVQEIQIFNDALTGTVRDMVRAAIVAYPPFGL